MSVADILTPARINAQLGVTSKKRVLERISVLLREDETELDSQAAFHGLVERERLGSTAIGDGVALPHARLKGLSKPVGAFVTLAQDVDYDAADRKPVKLVFALIVPEDASPEDMKLLGELATLFADQNLREQLLHMDDPQQIYRLLASHNNVSSRRAV
jgi:PTS system nitrogen regulatory IIA component